MTERETTEVPFPKNVVPLRTILQNFLNLVETCEIRRNGEVDLYDKEFQDLKLFSESLKSDSYYQCREGEKSVNRKKNRYKDILPFDFSRVSLSDYGDAPGSDYVNANFIKGASGSSAYIACQGPLPHTVNDFWRMVVECEVQVIVMACMEQESGKHKCENYWVEEDGIEREFGEVTVWLKKCRNVCPDFLVRTMRIRFPNPAGGMEERNVCQFHYSAWPDHGVPTKVRPLLDMVRLIRDCQTSETLPVLVHCSAGCGRTGTICAIDYVWGLLRLGKLSEDFSLFNLVREMRRQRIAMVQTKDQYILVHRAVKELFQEQLKIIEAHPYANVDRNGLPLEIRQELEEPTYETIDIHIRSSSSLPSCTPNSTTDESHNNSVSLKTPKLICKSGSSSSCKPMKEFENLQRQENEKVQEVAIGRRDYVNVEPLQQPKKSDLIESCDSAGEDTVDSSHFSVPKASESSTNANRGKSLLRKPSIVKLKAFFEKSSRQEKEQSQKATVTPTGLSRAKSDVSASSRFYSFASSFSGSRVGGSSSSSSSLSPKEATLSKPLTADALQQKGVGLKPKPPILAKPILPMKRSKSLKVHPSESQLNSPFPKLVIQKPIKVCVKQTEIPKLQSVSSSFTQNSSTYEPKDYEMLPECKESPEPLNISVISRTDTPPLQSKPSVPCKTQVESGNNRSISIETRDNNRAKADYLKIPKSVSDTKQMKFDKLAPKSLSLLNSSVTTSGFLTRSQSHIWHPTKESEGLTGRIFSIENLGSSDTEKRNQKDLLRLEQTWSEMKKTVADGLVGKSKTENGNLNMPLSPLLGNPIARRRMPKVSPYMNYPIEPKQCNLSCAVSNGHSGTQNYTSDSSNSLHSTPTQSIDRLCSQFKRNIARSTQIQPNPPRSILKGSLSSTPSDSDERIDSTRSYASAINTSVVTISNTIPGNKLTTNICLPLGLRERRNSFRQAVWKEAQSDTNQNQVDGQDSVSPYLTASALCSNNVASLPISTNGEGLLSSHRTYKDYEPIWPSETIGKTNSQEKRGTPPGSSSNFSSTPYESRFGDINVLLEELKAPFGAPGSSVKTPNTGEKSPATVLKYHRSLKAPSRSEYEETRPGGSTTLSCFTFRKPSSLESITGQLEESGGQKSSFVSREGVSSQGDSSPSHGLHSGRYSNDYVTLRQCKTDSGGFFVAGEDEVDMSPSPKRHPANHHNPHGVMPVPPPRTKTKRVNQLYKASASSATTESNANSVNGKSAYHHSETQQEKPEANSAINLPDPLHQRNSRDVFSHSSGFSTTSPNSITRAIGLLHDMKSKLVNWAEPVNKDKESQSGWSSKNQSKRGSGQSNGSTSSGSTRESQSSFVRLGDKNGFTSSKTKSATSRTAPKHQYL